MSHVPCQIRFVACPMSHVNCHLPPVTNANSHRPSASRSPIIHSTLVLDPKKTQIIMDKQGPSGTNHGLGVNLNNDGPKRIHLKKNKKSVKKRKKKKFNNSQKRSMRSKTVKMVNIGQKRSTTVKNS